MTDQKTKSESSAGIISMLIALFSFLVVLGFLSINRGEKWDNAHGGILFIFCVVPAMLGTLAGFVIGVENRDSKKVFGRLGAGLNILVLVFILFTGGFDFFTDMFYGITGAKPSYPRRGQALEIDLSDGYKKSG